MANHAIPLVSPIQVIQASAARNTESFASPHPSTPPATGVGEHPTAAVNVSPGTITTDVQTMQSSDATAFVYGSTASEKSVAANNYTTVDDAAKLASRVATDNDVIAKILREDHKKKRPQTKKAPQTKEKTITPETTSENLLEEDFSAEDLVVNNSMLVISRGRV